MSRLENWRDVLALCLVLVGLHQMTGAAVIKAKAWLAPVLIEQAWQKTLDGNGMAVKPWPWADTWPVARLRAPAQGVDLLVLAGDSGNALAFGPGHAQASAPLGAPGQSVIGGHRDTHFAFLQHLQAGDALQLQLPAGEVREYRVQVSRVLDAKHESLSLVAEQEALLLVTCYPFDALSAGGSLRYAVTALPNVSHAEQGSAGNRVYAL
jgi:sortase A